MTEDRVYIHGDLEFVQKARQQIAERRAREISVFRELAVEPSVQLEQCVDEMNNSLLSYYEKLGIENIQPPDNIFFIPKSKAAEIREQFRYIPDDSRAVNVSGTIIVYVPDSYDTDVSRNNAEQDYYTQIEEAMIASAYAHELYHSVSGRVYEAYKTKSQGFITRLFKKDDKVATKSMRSGLSYLLPEEVRQGDALEEGLADIWTTREEKIVKQHFPQGSFYNENDTTLNDYPNSNALVRFLMVKDPDFLRLAELARIRGETLSLARHVDKRHGKGIYRKVASATEASEAGVLEELKA